MSTEHQKYSTDNQSADIRAYAERRGFEIVRTYADKGKSGLRMMGAVHFSSFGGYIPARRGRS